MAPWMMMAGPPWPLMPPSQTDPRCTTPPQGLATGVHASRQVLNFQHFYPEGTATVRVECLMFGVFFTHSGVTGVPHGEDETFQYMPAGGMMPPPQPPMPKWPAK
eukprot:1157833-Pelagomonas_calceolata.AAC.1